MNPDFLVFIDANAWIGLINLRDYLAPKTLELMLRLRRENNCFLTTAPILFEVLDGLSTRDRRLSGALRNFVQTLDCEVVFPDEVLFERAWQFFDSRRDKEWSLTDCLSFVVMQERGIVDALTYDHHFEQAGFRALLRQN